MHKNNFFIIKLKPFVIPFLFCLFIIGLLVFSKENMNACKDGLILWINNVVPSLFPFFVATELLCHTTIPKLLGKLFHRIMRPIFNVPGEGAFALIMGIISGYPTGAKIITNFRKDGICSKEEGERLLTFTNNSGPLFIIGTVGISLFLDTRTGILLFITHILSCLTVGFLFRFWKNKSSSFLPTKLNSKKIDYSNNTVTFSTLGNVLSESILKSISTLVLIGGFVAFFSVLLSILKQSNILNTFYVIFLPILEALSLPTSFITPFFIGIIELTNGVNEISQIIVKNISINITLCAFLLGFGGFSVLLQVWGIISKTDLSIFPYFIGKLIQGIFAAFYTYLALKYIPFFSLDLQPVFASSNSVSPINYAFTPFLLLFLFICFFIFISKKKLFHKLKPDM